jgi:hypothetical protein
VKHSLGIRYGHGRSLYLQEGRTYVEVRSNGNSSRAVLVTPLDADAWDDCLLGSTAEDSFRPPAEELRRILRAGITFAAEISEFWRKPLVIHAYVESASGDEKYAVAIDHEGVVLFGDCEKALLLPDEKTPKRTNGDGLARFTVPDFGRSRQPLPAHV